MDITRLLDHGPVELREVRGGRPHRRVVTPGDDLSGLPDAVREAIAAHWTPERVAAWEAANAPPDMAAEEAAEAARRQRLDEVRAGRAEPRTLDEVIARLAAIEARLPKTG